MQARSSVRAGNSSTRASGGFAPVRSAQLLRRLPSAYEHRPVSTAAHLCSDEPAVSRQWQPTYEAALEYARACQYRPARVLFEQLLKRQPRQCKAWVSYAMVRPYEAECSCGVRNPTAILTLTPASAF